MGWYGQEGRGTHAEIDRETMKGYTRENGEVITFTDCKLTLTSHWHVMRINGEPKAIIHEMIQRAHHGRDGNYLGWEHEWLYKPLDEFMGPVEVNCPLSLLSIVPEPTDENDSHRYARDWRQRVRDFHAKRSAISLKGLRKGDRVQLKDHITPASYAGAWLTVDTFIKGKVMCNGYVHVKRSLIQAVERMPR
jgi:hypothetical protein